MLLKRAGTPTRRTRRRKEERGEQRERKAEGRPKNHKSKEGQEKELARHDRQKKSPSAFISKWLSGKLRVGREWRKAWTQALPREPRRRASHLLSAPTKFLRSSRALECLCGSVELACTDSVGSQKQHGLAFASSRVSHVSRSRAGTPERAGRPLGDADSFLRVWSCQATSVVACSHQHWASV
ncbi:eIF2 kinase IF2K-C [Toxoplasma gondii VEG]|uniref:EIF2 kinase IF2K-C n=2 Tax=Toxoplasma gondii TaxID=5811 RepID=V4ZLS2_TOXGV|nr:eIF2 kinase IF2K-C [Toxoplasma gondii VEG]KFG46327.1 eIF2 kinase IF2K-C [Toxoplasma gondii p89]